MVAGLPLSPEVLPWLLAGTVLLGLAGWLLHLDPRKPVNRVFSIFLVLRGVLALSSALFHNQAPVADGGLLDTLTWGSQWLVPALHIALPFAAIHFALVFRSTYLHDEQVPVSGGWTALVALAFLTLYFVDPSLWRTGAVSGPLFLFVGLTYLSYALLALMLGWEYLGHQGPVRGSFLLVAVAFSLAPAYLSLFEILGLDVGIGLLGTGGLSLTSLGGFFVASHALVDLSVLPLLLLAGLWLRAALQADDPEERGRLVRALGGMGIAAATGVLGALAFMGFSVTGGVAVSSFFEGMWDAVFPVVIAYSLMRHQLFGLDLKVKGAVEQSALAAAFAVIFITVSESMESILPVESTALSILAAVVIALLLHPLQRFAQGAATALLPHVRTPEELARAEQRALYREQVEIVWADGTLSSKDERMLQAARERLGMGDDEAARIRAQVRRSLEAEGKRTEQTERQLEREAGEDAQAPRPVGEDG